MVWPPKIDLTGFAEVKRTPSSILWRDAVGHLEVTDHEGRVLIPEEDRVRFWSMDTSAQVDYLMDLLYFGRKTDGQKPSAAWVAERFAYIGIIPAPDMMLDVGNVLRGAYENEPQENVKEQLRAIGVRV